MLDRARGGASRGDRVEQPTESRQQRRRHRPLVENLETRSLLAASLAPIADVAVPENLGIQVPLNGSGSNSTNQIYTVVSSNPSIKATVAKGKFLTMTVTHLKADNRPDDVLINGAITYQLFDDLTPLTASRIEQFTTSGFYKSKTFHRVAPGFPGPDDFIVQGGSKSGDGSGNSGEPGTPFVDEFVQQLAFTGKDQVAMANSGPDTNDTQFFFTEASPTFLNFKHTIFGQIVSGSNIVDQMTHVARDANNKPVSPIIINSADLSDTNPNGVIHIDATQAAAGQSAVITVTAADPTTQTTTTRSFTVRVDANTQNERPFVQQLPYPTQIVTTPPGSPTQPAVVYIQNVAINQKNIFQIPAVDPEGDQLTYIVKRGVQTTNGTTTFTDIPATQGTATVDQATGIVTFTPAQGFSGQVNLLVGVRDQTNRASPGTLDDPANFDYHQIILNVQGTTPVPLTPIAVPVNQTVAANTPTTVQLNGVSANPATSTGLTFTLTTQPKNGTITNFDASAGTFTYTAKPNFEGTDTFQYTVTDSGTGATPLTSPPATVTLTVTQASTGTVRQIGRVLVVTPAPRTDGGTNTIVVKQVNDAEDDTKNKLQVVINGVIDVNQPLVSAIDRIVVYGAKANDQISVDTSVDDAIRVTLDGGHGGRNNLQGALGPTREHGWFGQNVLRAGAGVNELIGRKGHVRFVPTTSTKLMFKGQGHPPRRHNHTTPPSGTFFKLKNGRIVPIPTPHRPNGGAINRFLAKEAADAYFAFLKARQDAAGGTT